MTAEPVYLVWSNDAGSWWRENGGYTGDVWQARRYDEAGAREACNRRSPSTFCPVPEVMVLAPENTQRLFSVDDIRAVPDLMQSRIDKATKAARDARRAVAEPSRAAS